MLFSIHLLTGAGSKSLVKNAEKRTER